MNECLHLPNPRDSQPSMYHMPYPRINEALPASVPMLRRIASQPTPRIRISKNGYLSQIQLKSLFEHSGQSARRLLKYLHATNRFPDYHNNAS
jgi:hypothetical protein